MKVVSFKGSAREAGASYAEHYRRECAGFFTQEFGSYRASSPFIRSCVRHMRKSTPKASAFLQGMASESLLTREQLALVLLHEEELYHRKLMKKSPHCSAAAIASNVGKEKNAVLGQNWDWSSAYFPWMSLNRFSITAQPQVLALSFPGLPLCAGLNSSGLSLMWTGAGYYPPLKPVAGVPTYALTFELLLKRSVPEALEWLAGVRNSGAFIFFLADAQGRMAVVEGVPGKIFISSQSSAHRANVFELPAACKAARQRLPRKCNSRIRNKTFQRRFPHMSKKPPLKAVQEILSVPTIIVETAPTHATLVQLVASCRERALYVKFWRQRSRRWMRLAVKG